MSTAATADTTSGASTTSPSDPLDSLDFSDIVPAIDEGALDAEVAIPESMLLDGRRADPGEPVETAEGEAGEAVAGKPTKAEQASRDASGKFAKKEGEAEPASTARAFQYRAMGETHAVDGATEDADGTVTVPGAKAGELREAFNALHLLRGQYQPVLAKKEQENATLRQRVQEMEQSHGVNETKAQQLVDALSMAMNNPDDNAALNQLWALRQNWGTLVSRAEATHWKEQAERATKAPVTQERPETHEAPVQSPRTMPSVDDARSTTKEFLAQAKIAHAFRDVPDDVWKQIDADTERKPLMFLREATRDDATKYGRVEGETVFDLDLLHDHIQAERGKHAKSQETAQSAAKHAADTARRTQPRIDAPPVPGGSRSAPSKPRGQPFTSKQDYEDWLNSDEL